MARLSMVEHGFQPDLPVAAVAQADAARQKAEPGLPDLTGLLWSSLDNDDSRDLDQIEWAERAAGGIRVLVGIADVDSAVAKGTPIDLTRRRRPPRSTPAFARFPCCRRALHGPDVTFRRQDRVAVVVEMTVAADGSIGANRIYRALVRNGAQLTYGAVGRGWRARRRCRPRWRRRRICRRSCNCRTKRRTCCARRATGWVR